MSTPMNPQSEIVWVPVRHDWMHVLLAMLDLVEQVTSPTKSEAEEILGVQRLQHSLDQLEQDDGLERLMLELHERHHQICGRGAPNFPSDRRVAQLMLKSPQIKLLLMYDAFAVATIHEDMPAIKETLEQLLRFVNENGKEPGHLQRDIQRAASAAFGDEIALHMLDKSEDK